MHQWDYDDIGNRVQQIVTPYGQGAIATLLCLSTDPNKGDMKLK
jgi:hypothetical protein